MKERSLICKYRNLRGAYMQAMHLPHEILVESGQIDDSRGIRRARQPKRIKQRTVLITAFFCCM